MSMINTLRMGLCSAAFGFFSATLLTELNVPGALFYGYAFLGLWLLSWVFWGVE